MIFGLTGTEEPSGAEVRRTRRDVSGRFEVVSEMETPDVGVPESQFEVPKEEQRGAKAPRITIERRAVSKHTETFKKLLDTNKQSAAQCSARSNAERRRSEEAERHDHELR